MALKSYNNLDVPSFMYGTAWKKVATARCVQLAVTAGFRAIDTANQLIHYDEASVGEALRMLAADGLERHELFLQSKFTSLDGQDHRTPYDPSADLTTQVGQSFDSSLAHLGTDYLDSYLLHAPFQRGPLGRADWEVWSAMERLCESRKTRMIGISNVTAPQLAQLCQQAALKPMMVQNRCYAVLGWDMEVREICRSTGIIYQGFSLLTANRQVLADGDVRAMARRLNTGPAQVIFRFAMQVGMLPLTGTTNEAHMKEDLMVEEFTLSDAEVEYIETIGLT